MDSGYLDLLFYHLKITKL